MSNTKLKYIKYTKQELDEYVLDKGSCVNLVNSDMHISFPPWGFANFQETVTNIISRNKIGKYDTKMEGIVLDVRNIKVFGTSYAVHDDDPYNHINLNANFYVFQPRIGAEIAGVVKHISHRHVAAIIYRVFNVSIRFKKPPNMKLEINKNIKVKIKTFDLQDGLPYVEGELIEDAMTGVKRKIMFDDDDEEMENAVDSGISTEESSAKRRKTASTSGKVAEAATSSSEEDSDDEEADQNGLDLNDIKGMLFDNVKIKKEQITDDEDSSSESDDVSDDDNKKLQSALQKRQAKNGHDSNMSSDEDEDSDDVDTPVAAKHIKKEKNITSDSSESDSDSDDDDENIPTAVVKAEKNITTDDSDSSDEEETQPRVAVKQEPVTSSDESNDDDVPTAIKPTPVTSTASKLNGSAIKSGKKPPRNVSFSDRLDILLDETLKKKKKKNNQSKTDANLDSSIIQNHTLADVSEFDSPALSSTLKPVAKSGKKKSKNGNLLDSMLDETLRDLDVTPKVTSKVTSKATTKATPKSTPIATNGTAKSNKKSSSKKDKSLKAMEDDLFSSFLS